jgi:CDP-paratose 2-epimerase
MSTNKVYGDGPNRLNLVEQETRWDYADPEFATGIKESFPIDQCLHSLFGASQVAADVMVQEYGRYFQMPTCCLRGGCVTGPNHSGVELHGFLSYLIKCNLERNASRPASPESLSGPGDDRNCSALRQICCRLS